MIRFNQFVNRQLQLEDKEKLLPQILWPAMDDRELVTTREAATRMMEIVDLMGTAKERERTAIIMDQSRSRSQEEAVKAFQECSGNQVPTQWVSIYYSLTV